MKRKYRPSSKRHFLLTKKSLAQLLLILAIFALPMAGTAAYLTDVTASLVNHFTVGEAKVEIQEPGVDPNEVDWGTNTKVVTLEIPSGYISGVARALIVPVIKDLNGNVIGADVVSNLAKPVSNRMVLGDITLCFDPNWEDYWFFKDGYFYYKQVLNPNQTASHLLTGVILTNNTAATRAIYQERTVQIIVSGDVIQSVGNAASEWGVTVNNGVVS